MVFSRFIHVTANGNISFFSWLILHCMNTSCLFIRSPVLFFLILFIYFWLCWVFVAECRLSLVGTGWSYPRVCRLLIAVAFLVVEHGLQGARVSVVGAQ